MYIRRLISARLFFSAFKLYTVCLVLSNIEDSNKLHMASKSVSVLPSQVPQRDMSRVMRKPAFCICENKDADQLRGNREADQRLCFRYTDSAIPLLPKSEISSL